MKNFNVTGTCVPDEDYMVDISGKIEKIVRLVNDRSYFTINRARQYGKTTTLLCLEKALRDDYTVASISFQGIGDETFASSEKFCPLLVKLIVKALKFSSASKEYIDRWIHHSVTDFQSLSEHITAMCENEKVVLMVDEVDATSNNRVFLQFIGMLRDKFLARKSKKDHTFHSVILAGVYDIKNIKLKLINEGLYEVGASEGKLLNSPWNIAVSFNVDMSFSPAEISTMLNEYEADHVTGMNVAEISRVIYSLTNGYPFLVSAICQHIDKVLNKDWTVNGIDKAVRILLVETNTLFDDLVKNLETNESLYNLIYDILIVGDKRVFNIYNPTISLGLMYGILRNADSHAAISNKIFELIIYEYLISKDELKGRRTSNTLCRGDVIKNGSFDMELCLRKFSDHYAEIYSKNDLEFLERHGRLLFLSYLRSLINGHGFYHIESQFTDLRRMDIVVDFGQDQFIVELKIWRGEQYEHKAYEQLLGYMDSKKASSGYLLMFDFRNDMNRQTKVEWIEVCGKRIFEVIA